MATASALAFVFAGAVGGWLGGVGWGNGTWTCAVCGESRDEYSWCGIPAYRGGPSDSEDQLALTASYREWYQRESNAPHEHVWIAVGCHGKGQTVFCCGHRLEPFHRITPLIRDPDLALRFQAAFVSGLAEGRRGWLRGVMRAEDGFLYDSLAAFDLDPGELDRRVLAVLSLEDAVESAR